MKDDKHEAKADTCPNCGYCPTCGRARASYPVYPGTAWPYYPYAQPWWGTTTINVAGGTSATYALSN